jgi:hypothetical protein
LKWTEKFYDKCPAPIPASASWACKNSSVVSD